MEQKKKKYRGRRSYLNDYELDESGAYVYNGTEYIWKSPRKEALIKIWLLSLAAFAMQILAGCVPDVGMNGRAWVLLPYAAALASSVSLLWGSYTLTDGGERIPEHIYKKSADALPVRSILTIVFSGVAILGELVNLIWQSQFDGSISGAVIYMVSEAAGVILALLLRKTVLGLEWERKEEPEE
ncbi:MAG: hypothetical protein LUI87_06745 [Lachnospiraceae bacterium]|nr:hypothetical protein [Lachnospiraceae bacterium]